MFFLILSVLTRCGDDEKFPLANRCGAPGVAVYQGSDVHLFGSDPGSLSTGEINSYVRWGEKRIWLISNGVLNQETSSVLLRNCLLLEGGTSSGVIYSRQQDQCCSFLPEPDERHFFSLNQGLVVDNLLQIIVSRWKITGEGRAGVEHEASFVYTFSLSDWHVVDKKRIDARPELMFGSALLSHQGYVYIYTTKNALWNKEALVARVSGDFLQPWEYYDGYTWQSSADAMKPVLSDVADFFSVFVQDENVYAMSHGALLSPEVKLHHAHSPEEGWQFKKVLYCESTGDDATYAVNAIAIEHSSGRISSAYSRIDRDLQTTGNARPAFVEITGWDYY